MKPILNFILLILFLLYPLQAKELEKVSLQLQWFDQFQFAGYYIAKEKGFYKEAGLDVEIKKFDYGITSINEVLNGKATYGIGCSSLIIDKSLGKKINLLASIFQSSPSVLLARKDSNINSISNEPFILKEKGIKYTVFDPKDYGFDFYSDILFTSSDEIKNHKQRAINFKKASLKGWEYAFKHIDESVELILQKYNSQKKSKKALLFEAEALKELAFYENKELGNIDIGKLERIDNIYNTLGLVENPIDFTEFIVIEKKSIGFLPARE